MATSAHWILGQRYLKHVAAQYFILQRAVRYVVREKRVATVASAVHTLAARVPAAPVTVSLGGIETHCL